jgi:hypothetical protein
MPKRNWKKNRVSENKRPVSFKRMSKRNWRKNRVREKKRPVSFKRKVFTNPASTSELLNT